MILPYAQVLLNLQCKGGSRPLDSLPVHQALTFCDRVLSGTHEQLPHAVHSGATGFFVNNLENMPSPTPYSPIGIEGASGTVLRSRLGGEVRIPLYDMDPVGELVLKDARYVEGGLTRSLLGVAMFDDMGCTCRVCERKMCHHHDRHWQPSGDCVPSGESISPA